MKIAAAYIRVSTDEQGEYSPDSQLKMIRDYAKRNDMLVPEEYVFVDDGISGRNTNKRPAFNQMIGTAKLKPKPFDAILLWKFSRFARNREDSIVYKSMLRKQLGIEVISVSENLGDDKMSILIEAMIEAMDEYYSINLAEEVKRGMVEKVSRGEPVSIPPFGYDIREKQYIPNPDTAPIVQMIFREFAQGTGYKELAVKLNAMGIRTRRGNPWENRTVSYLLNNPVYIGKIHWSISGAKDRDFHAPDIMLVDGSHPPIIDLDTWEAVQSRIRQIKGMYPKYARPAGDSSYMLQGLVRCSSCGRTLVRVSNRPGMKSMQCHGYARGQCNVSHSIVMHRLEELVLSQIEADTLSGNFQLTIRQPQGTSDMLPLLDAQIQREESKLERVREAYASGADTLEEYKANKQKILSRIAELQKQRPAQQEDWREAALQNFKKRCQNALVQLRDPAVSPQEKNALLRSFVDQVVFSRPQGNLQVFYYAQ